MVEAPRPPWEVSAVPILPESLAAIHPSLQLDACLRELHVVTPQGDVRRGWDAVAELARLFPVTFVIGWLGIVPPFSWLGRAAYRFVARNRYAVSKCRGGACRVARPDQVKQKSFFGTFWSCYLIGLLIRLPLIAGAGASDMIGQWSVHIRTFRRRIDFPGSKLTVLFLGGIPCDVVPLLFGELFTAILYDGVLIDPGSPRMRRSLARHLRRMPPGTVRAVAATHHHEEHVGNLNWAAQTTATPLYLSSDTARLLASPWRLPWVRAAIIGQPEALRAPFEILRSGIQTKHGHLEVIATPGHCDDHIVFYDRSEKVLIAGDAFMGSYFATPNADVDSCKWMDTLERLLTLDIEFLVEGHGHVHTLRPDFPEFPESVPGKTRARRCTRSSTILCGCASRLNPVSEKGLAPLCRRSYVLSVGPRARLGELFQERTDPRSQPGALLALGTSAKFCARRIRPGCSYRLSGAPAPPCRRSSSDAEDFLKAPSP